MILHPGKRERKRVTPEFIDISVIKSQRESIEAYHLDLLDVLFRIIVSCCNFKNFNTFVTIDRSLARLQHDV